MWEAPFLRVYVGVWGPRDGWSHQRQHCLFLLGEALLKRGCIEGQTQEVTPDSRPLPLSESEFQGLSSSTPTGPPSSSFPSSSHSLCSDTW